MDGSPLPYDEENIPHVGYIVKPTAATFFGVAGATA
jgi:hypothetical protein